MGKKWRIKDVFETLKTKGKYEMFLEGIIGKTFALCLSIINCI